MIHEPIIKEIKDSENKNSKIEFETENLHDQFKYTNEMKSYCSSNSFSTTLGAIVSYPLRTYLAKKIFSTIATFGLSVSAISFFLKLFNIYSYAEQLKIISTKNFSLQTMIWYGIYSAAIIVIGILSTAHNGEVLSKKFSSVWVPISYAMTCAFLIPDSNGVSVFSYFVKMIVSFWATF